MFEVRGLETDDLRGAKVGVIFYGSEGYVVLTSYAGGAAFDPSGKLVRKFHGGGDHFGNFIDAVKARDPKLLHADILEGHLSCAHSHLANISYYLGKPASVEQIGKTLAALSTKEDVADCLQRTLKHLAANGVDLAKTPMSLGPMLKIDAAERNDPRQPRRLRDADAASIAPRSSCRRRARSSLCRKAALSPQVENGVHSPISEPGNNLGFSDKA